MSTLTDKILRRSTFAVISHPEAGKMTLTEKLLLFGGAIQFVGEVKARGECRTGRGQVERYIGAVGCPACADAGRVIATKAGFCC